MKKILVTGGSGFLGSRVCLYYTQMRKKDMEILAPSHKEMDITQAAQVKEYLLEHKPDAVFHCGGISDTEYVRTHPKESAVINVEGTYNLALLTGSMGIPLIFTSSDYVYQGKTIAGESYDRTVDAFREEDAETEHEYGRQKLEAERVCFAYNPLSKALRLTWMYDLPKDSMAAFDGKKPDLAGMLLPLKQNLLTNLLKARKEKQPISFACHEYRGVTNVWDVVKNLEKALQLPTGSYNFGCTNFLPTIQVARKAAKWLGVSEELVLEDEKRYADRPRNISMSIEKLKNYGIDFGSTLEGLEGFFSDWTLPMLLE